MTEVAVEVTTRLALYLGCLVVALVAGWALGQMAVLVDPQMSVPGTAPSTSTWSGPVTRSL